MTYAGERTIFDADSHLLELPDFLSSHADTRTRRLLPDLGAALVGQFNPGQYDQKHGHAPERVQQLVELGDNLTRGPKWHEALGSFNGPERAQALDLLGFTEQVVFSSFCARLIFDPDNDRRVAYGGAAAHNRAMAEFCSADNRLIGVAMVPLQDADLALKELEHARQLGLGAVWVPSDPPAGRSRGRCIS